MANLQFPLSLENNIRDYTQTTLTLQHPGTRKNTLSKLQRFLGWAVSREQSKYTTWCDTVPKLLDEYVQWRLKTPSARGFMPNPDTIKRDLQVVRDWVLWNEERELTGPIRSAHVIRPLPKHEREEIHFLTPEQEKFILDRARWIHEGGRGLRFPDVRNGRETMTNARQTGWVEGAFRLYFLLMMRQGLRPAEAMHLRWDEVFLDADPPLMKLQRIEDDEGKAVRGLKTKKSEDAVTIARCIRPEARDQWSGPSEGVDLVAELREFKDRQKAECTLGDWVFGKVDQWTNEIVFPDDSFIWRALKHETNDPNLKAYSCRHTVGTRLSARGFQAEQVSRVLRNTARVCERYYIAGTRLRDAFDINTGQRVQVKSIAG